MPTAVMRRRRRSPGGSGRPHFNGTSESFAYRRTAPARRRRYEQDRAAHQSELKDLRRFAGEQSLDLNVDLLARASIWSRPSLPPFRRTPISPESWAGLGRNLADTGPGRDGAPSGPRGTLVRARAVGVRAGPPRTTGWVALYAWWIARKVARARSKMCGGSSPHRRRHVPPQPSA